MLEILELYVSGFWTWLGITIGMYLIVIALAEVMVCFIGLFK